MPDLTSDQAAALHLSIKTRKAAVFSRICDNSPRNTVSTRKRYFAIGARKGTAKDT